MASGTSGGTASVSVFASATGGAAGTDTAGGTPGALGAANATAIAYGSSTTSSAGADALAIGLSGTAFARSIAAWNGFVTQIEADATAPIATDGQSSAFTDAAIDQPFSIKSTSFDSAQVGTMATAAPNASAVSQAVSSTVNVQNGYDANIETGDPLGLLALGTQYSLGGTGPQTYTSSVTLSLDLNALPHGMEDLELGFFNPVSTGAGFDSLTFQILENGVSVIDESFATLASADAYFGDQFYDLGLINLYALQNGDLTIDLSLAATDSLSNESFGASMLVLNEIPEPGNCAAFGLGFALIMLLQHRRGSLRVLKAFSI
jgi:hypothetical protein